MSDQSIAVEGHDFDDADALLNESRGARHMRPNVTAPFNLCRTATIIIVFAAVLAWNLFPEGSAHEVDTPLYPFVRSNAPQTSIPPSLIVGTRAQGPFYPSKECSSTQYLEAVNELAVEEGGLSTLKPENRSYELEDFTFSFPWKSSCPKPHIFSSAEACDLLAAYQGLFMAGDSIMRHVGTALFLLLTGRPDGAAASHGDTCRGDFLFDEKDCRPYTIRNSDDKRMQTPLCDGRVQIRYIGWPCPLDPEGLPRAITAWRSGGIRNKTALSSAVISSWGLHCRMKHSIITNGAVRPLLKYAEQSYPSPALLWLGLSAPGYNKPVQYLREQGADQVQKFNKAVRASITNLRNGTVHDGAMPYMSTYGITQGAYSFDGTHYGYQVNMEKAQLLLNLLDLWWSEAVNSGGLWEIEAVCLPRGPYQCNPDNWFHGTITP